MTRTLTTCLLYLTLWANQCYAEAPGASSPPATRYTAASLYNAGNAFARAGKPGMAVLNYQRARLLAPSDPDIAANLRRVREASRVPGDEPSGFERAGLLANPTQLAWTGLLGVLVAGAALSLGSPDRYRGLRRLAIGIGIALVSVTVGNAWILWPLLHDAVVLTAATEVRTTPVPMGDPLFTLPEAQTVRITAEHDDFVLVETRSGRTGWVARANLAAVVPGTMP